MIKAGIIGATGYAGAELVDVYKRQENGSFLKCNTETVINSV